MPIIIRPLRREEFPLLEEFLYLAIHQPPGAQPLPFTCIYEPEIYTYIEDFGARPTDRALVAQLPDGTFAGAVWTRILAGPVRGFGNVDDKTPEFAISVRPQCRGQGVGTALMRAACEQLQVDGFKRATLSVDKNNRAVKFYRSAGFLVIEENEQDYLMEITFG